jgi:hypothetical protein
VQRLRIVCVLIRVVLGEEVQGGGVRMFAVTHFNLQEWPVEPMLTLSLSPIAKLTGMMLRATAANPSTVVGNYSQTAGLNSPCAPEPHPRYSSTLTRHFHTCYRYSPLRLLLSNILSHLTHYNNALLDSRYWPRRRCTTTLIFRTFHLLPSTSILAVNIIKAFIW